MDTFEQIAFDTPVGCCCVVLGNIPTGDFALVDPSLVPLSEDTAADFRARGLGFVATFGIVDGKFVYALARSVSEQLAALLFQDYSVFLLKKFKARRSTADTGTEWLARLWSLPDTRQEN